MFRFIDWLASQWPFVLSGAAVAVGFTAWVQRLKSIQELQLKVTVLERQIADGDRHIVPPTPEEVAKFGAPKKTGLRVDLPTLLLVLALTVPLGTYAYNEINSRKQNATLRARIALVAKDFDATQRQLDLTSGLIQELQRRAIQELFGTGGTQRPGAGPAFAALKRQEAALRQQQLKLQVTRDALDNERRRLETQLAR